MDGREADTPGRVKLKRGGGVKTGNPAPNLLCHWEAVTERAGGEITVHERLRGCDWVSEIEQKTGAGRTFFSCHGPPGVERVALLSHRGKDR